METIGTKMKAKALFSRLAVVGLLTALPVSAMAGTKDGVGGGNGAFSTEEDVREILEKDNAIDFKNELASVYSDLWSFGFFDPVSVEDSELKETLKLPYFRSPRGTNNEQPAYQIRNEIHELKPVLREKCLDSDGVEHDSSTSLSRYSPICYSLERLKRIPKNDLKNQLMALTIHEILHHVGIADENVATKFQNYFDSSLRLVPQTVYGSANGQIVKAVDLKTETARSFFVGTKDEIEVSCSAQLPVRIFNIKDFGKNKEINKVLYVASGSATDFGNRNDQKNFDNILRVRCWNFPVRPCQVSGKTFLIGSDAIDASTPEQANAFMKYRVEMGVCK